MPLSFAKTMNFEDKQRWFKLQLEKNRISWTFGSDILAVSKANILKDSVQKIKNCNLHKVLFLGGI